jgi:hypothetical protein
VAAGQAHTSARAVTVTLIGDSVADRVEQMPIAAQAFEDRLAVRVRLAVCRRLASPSCSFQGVRPPSALEEIKLLGPRVGRVVVLAIGYNETPRAFSQGVGPVMTALAAGGAARVIWVTLHERQASYHEINATIMGLARRWPRLVRVADWSALSAGQPWFEQDDVHLNETGALALARLLHASIVAACGAACTSVPIPDPLQPTPAAAPRCPARSGGPWVAVLARARSAPQALSLRNRAIAAGFGQSVIVQPGPTSYEIVLFGFPDRDGAVGIYLEAKARGFRATPLPNTGPCGDADGDWEVVFGHRTTQADARALLARVNTAGFTTGSAIEVDGPGDYEVAVAGIQSTSQFADVAARALSAGSAVSFEPS